MLLFYSFYLVIIRIPFNENNIVRLVRYCTSIIFIKQFFFIYICFIEDEPNTATETADLPTTVISTETSQSSSRKYFLSAYFPKALYNVNVKEVAFKIYIRQESQRTGRVKISSISFAHFSNYNLYLVSVGRGMGRNMFEMQIT